MSLRRLATGLAVVPALIASACSSTSSPTAPPPHVGGATPASVSAAAYRTALHRVALEENAAQHKVQAAFHARTVSQVRTALATFSVDQRHAAQQIAAVSPPANAVTANAELARAFNDNAVAINAILKRIARAKNVKQALGIVQNDQQAQRVGHEIDTALNKLRKLGYTSGS
jgi:hypothetical protein